MLRRDISRVLLASVAGSTLLTRQAQAQTGCTSPCYAATASELAGGLTPVTAYAPTPLMDARRFGFATGASAAVNAAAVANAILALRPYPSGGPFGAPQGTIQLPAGVFDCEALAIPAQVIVRGAGKCGTYIRYPGNNYFAILGGTGNALYYGTGITDLSILLQNVGGHAVLAQGTMGAEIGRLYIEGQIVTGRSNRGVCIDGCNASSFSNRVFDVDCNHVQRGFMIFTTGTTEATQTIFDNCQALGDVSSVGSASVGLTIGDGQGSGTIWLGGNLEALGTGVEHASSAQSISVLGARFEGNGIEVLFDSFCSSSSYIGCLLDAAKVTDNSQTGFQAHNFVGCHNGSGQSVRNQLIGSNVMRAALPADIPAQVVGYPTQVTRVLSVENSAGTVNFQVAPNGNIGFFGAPLTGRPTITGSRGGNVALASLLTQLASLGLIVDGSS